MRNVNYWFIIVFGSILIGSCSKDNDDFFNDQPDNDYLISVTKVSSYTQQQVNFILNSAENLLGGDIDISDKNIDGVNVYYVEYKSEYINNESITLSGLVCTPANKNTEAIMVSFQNGTIALHSNAPTKQLTNPDYVIMHALAGLGFVVTIPDNIGFGVSEEFQHPYHHKELFQRSITDLIYATIEMDRSTDYPFNLANKLFLTGYSLGGWASLVTHHYLEQNPIENMELLGSACGAGAYNLVDMRDYLVEQDYYSQPFYIPNMLMGYQSVGDLSEEISCYINEPYASKIPELIDGEHSADEINQGLTTDMQALFTTAFINEFHSETLAKWIELKNVLVNNSQPAWINSSPITLYHGNEDTQVPYSLSETLHEDFRAIGVSDTMLTLITLEGASHATGSAPMYLQVINELLDY
jgi:hypothetical protein